MAQFNQMQNPMNRMGTPQNAAQQNMMRGMAAGGNPNVGMDASGMNSPFPNNQQGQTAMTPHIEAMQRQYQQQLARSQQQMQSMQQNQPRTQQGGWPGANGQPSGRPGMPQGPGPVTDSDRSGEAHFLKSLRQFCEQKGKQMNDDPRICGQRVSLCRLFQQFTRLNPTTLASWQQLASEMGFPPAQNPSAPQELQQMFDRDLRDFHTTYMSMRAMQNRNNNRRPTGPGQMPHMPGQGSPTRSNESLPQGPGIMGFQQPSQASSPHLGMSQTPGQSQQTSQQPASAAEVVATNVNGHRKSGSLFSNISTPEPQHTDTPLKAPQSGPTRTTGSALLGKPDSDSLFDPKYQPRYRPLAKYGGVDLEPFSDSGSKIRDLRTYPRFEELGNVDLHTLNMCLLSGFTAETKYALDRLCALSQAPLRLWECEDLLDSLVECGERQVTQLMQSMSPAADGFPPTVGNFHDTIKLGTTEIDTLSAGNAFGDASYKKDHAIDKLLAVTTVLRNLSFPLIEANVQERDLEANAKLLTGHNVRNLLSGCIKCLDEPRGLDLKSARNAQDLMKDVVTILSNISDAVELASEEEARMFLEVLLAFAPSSSKRLSEGLEFTMYSPLKHQYLPCAVDSLAKLLARDEPNRSFFRSIFSADSHEQKPVAQLLIFRAFALAISPIPDAVGGVFSPTAATQIAHQRRPFLSQGMLAADILSTLIPSPSTFGFNIESASSLERLLLTTADGWASRLMRMILTMAITDLNTQPARDRTTHQVLDGGRPFSMITQRGLSMLRRMLERADKAETDRQGRQVDSVSLGLFATAPLESVLFSAMSMPSFDMETMRLLTAIASMAK